MKNINEFEACDMILSHLIENPNTAYDERKLKKELFESVELDVIKVLIEIITARYPPVASVHRYNDGGIKCNGITKQFIEGGGFTGVRNKQIEEDKSQEHRKSVEYEKLSLEVEKLRNDYFDYPETKRRAKTSLILSGIAVGLAALTLLQGLMCNKPD